jgi:hypothetical protein
MTAAVRRHIAKVVALGCIVCKREGYGYSPAECHHIRHSGKRDNKRIIPICPRHHRTGGHGFAVHAGLATWQQKYGTEEELLRLVIDML